MSRILVASAVASAALAAAATAPKVILSVIVDDLGFAGPSFNRRRYGQAVIPPEQNTPSMDAAAGAGVILDRHYVYRFCSPSRSSFLSGRLPIHVQQQNILPTAPSAGIPRDMTVLAEKLRGAGYTSHMVGKWDAGAATWDHTPEGRGFDSSLIYFGHRVNYYTQVGDGCNAMDVFNGTVVDLWDSGGPATGMNGTGFVDYMFLNRSLDIIASFAAGGMPFNTSNGPRAAAGERLWLNHALHATHDPIQAPEDIMRSLNYTTDDETACAASVAYVWPGSQPSDIACRRQYESLLQVADNVLGALVAALVKANLWNDTLLIFSSDNGGQQWLEYNAGSNWPLRGGKASEFEGGIRSAAFVSGGYVPAAVRGTVSEGFMHIADWYGTLCTLAGVDAADGRAAAAGLPPVDSVDVWPLLTGANTTSPRVDFAATEYTLVTPKWKLIVGGVHTDAGWSDGAFYPNASTPGKNDPYMSTLDCTAPCLFDVSGDLGEHDNVAGANPAIVSAMTARLQTWVATFYTNNETFPYACPPSVSDSNCSCWLAETQYGGFVGPFQV